MQRRYPILWVLILSVACMPALKAQTPVNTAHVNTAPGNKAVYTPAAYAGSIPLNYIRTWTPLQPYTTESEIISTSRTVKQVNKSTQYIDGLGRPLQTVGWQISPGKKDIVAPIVYDAMGRESYIFLPYTTDTAVSGLFQMDPFGDQHTFYSINYPIQQPALTGESFFYSHLQYETSPLGRVEKSFAPGNNWVGSEGYSSEHAVTMQYLSNLSIDSVYHWEISNDTLQRSNGDYLTNIPAVAGIYDTGKLVKTITTDEHNNSVVEYKDLDGHVVLKKVKIDAAAGTAHIGWLCTYYVYDDLGNLRFVISPKAVAALLAAGSWDLKANSSVIVQELCFRYEYDGRNRIIAKKVPGADWEYMIYDQRDRLVFTQNGNMRSDNKWMYTLYDGFNRPVQTGMITTAIHPGYFQQWVMANTGNNTSSTVTTSGQYTASVPENLYINEREAGRTSYKASGSITIDDGFVSENDAEFVAEIVDGAGASFSNTVTVMDNPIPSGITGIPLTYQYYDDYSVTLKTYSTSDNSKLGNGANLYGEELPSAASALTKGLATVTRVRVIESPSDLTLGKWLETASFFDDKGRNIQVNTDNYQGGKDITTNKYDFPGKLICSYLLHTSSADTTRIRTNMDYDHAGRLLTITKQLNDNDATKRLIVRNSYDEMGQLLQKQLGQKSVSDTSALDIQDHAYNLRGWLKGENWNYGASSGPTTSQMNISNSKWFAFDLSYDWGYATNQYNGNIAGQRWVSAGDGTERSFGYGYDAANRLLFADFNQNFSGAWAKSSGSFGIDFSVKMGDGSDPATAYDYNGNILAMQQKGLKLNASMLIDNMTYAYAASSNKLLSVTDAVTGDNKLGDFTDNNTSGDDYAYDNNGNLLKDRNKVIGGSGANGIYYNHLNLPDSILVTEKGYIKYVYDAAGNKLEKRVVETNPVSKITTTNYLNGFVYKNNVLQFFGHEEGRIRLNHFVTLTNPTVYAYDYFLKDHLGNTRVVLTDEQQVDPYPAVSLEDGALTTDTFYYRINTANIVANPASLPSTYANNNGDPPYNTNPNVNTSATSTKMYRLNGSTGDKTGLNIALKVMAGDQIAIYGKSFWHSNGSNPNNSYTTVVNDLLTALAGSNTIVSASKGATAAALIGSAVTPSDVSNLLGSPPTVSGRPNAYINWILFDEQFRVISSNSGFDPVNTSADVLKSHEQSINITKSGYLYVYCSNESNQDVYFDNLQVLHVRGPLLEETHYYPFGLVMSGISSIAAGKLENRYKYNGKELQSKEFSDGSGLELYDYGARMQDPQLGRWWTPDAKANKTTNIEWSPYTYVADNPLKFIDPDGKDKIEVTKTIGKDGSVLVQTQITKGLFQSRFNSSYNDAGYYTKNDYQVTTVRDFRSGKEKTSTSTTTLYGDGHSSEIGFLEYAKIKITGSDGDIIKFPQIMVFGSASSGGALDLDGKADPNRSIMTINFAAFQEILGLITAGMEVPDLRGVSPDKIPELIDKYRDQKADEKKSGKTKPPSKKYYYDGTSAEGEKGNGRGLRLSSTSNKPDTILYDKP